MESTRYGLLGSAGGLDWNRLPLRLFADGNRKFWDPTVIDFSRDGGDWEALSGDEREYATQLCAEFAACAEAVIGYIQPLVSAMRAEGRLGDEMYLSQFAFEVAKQIQAFRFWLDSIGVSADLHRRLVELPTYRRIFIDELPGSLNALAFDPSPAQQIRASVTYTHVIKGMLALTRHYTWRRVCAEHSILPAMRELAKRMSDDERRHVAWATFTCRRHVATDDANWKVFETRTNQLIPLVLRLHSEVRALFRDELPFGLATDELMQYSTYQAMGRFRMIISARGRSVDDIDIDYTPMQQENEFATAERRALCTPATDSSPNPVWIARRPRAQTTAS